MGKLVNVGAQVEVALPPEQAQQAIERGEVAPSGKQIIFKGDRVLEIDASRLGEALDKGWTLTDDEGANEIILRREESDAGSTARAVVESGARALTFGASDLALDAAGLSGEPGAAQMRREELGGVGTAIEVGTGLAAGLAGVAGKGAGLAARTLGWTPAGLASKAGAGISSVGARAISGSGLAANAARATIPTAAGGAVEASFYGPGNELTEASLGEREVVAENMLQEGVMAAVLGGAAGAILPSVGYLASKAPKAAGAMLPNKAARDVMDALPERIDNGIDGAAGEGWDDKVVRGWGFLSGSNSDAMVDVYGFSKSPAKRELAYRAIHDYDGVLEETTREGVAALERANFVLNEATGIATGASKLRRVDELIPEHETPFAVRGMTRAALLKADGILAAAQLKGLSRPGSYVMNDLDAGRERIAQAINEMDDAAKFHTRDPASDADPGTVVGDPGMQGRMLDPLSPSDAMPVKRSHTWRDERGHFAGGTYREQYSPHQSDIDSFKAANRVKQDIDLITYEGRRALPTRDVTDTNRVLKEANNVIRGHLEDEAVFGRGAVLQKETNAAYTAMRRAEDELGSKNTVLGRMLDPSTPVQPGDMLALIKQYGKISGEAKVAKIDAALDARLAYIESVRTHFEHSPEQLAVFDSAAEAVKKMRAAFASKAEYADFLTALGKVRNDGSGPSINALSSVASVFGLATAGPLGLLAGRIVGSPYNTLRTLITLRHFADKASQKIDIAIGQSLGKLRAPPEGMKKVSKALTASKAPLASAVGAGEVVEDKKAQKIEKGNSRAETLRLIERVKQIIQDPNTLQRETELPFFEVNETAPRLVNSILANAFQTAAYLYKHLPNIYRAPFDKNIPPLYDQEKMAAFERRAAVAKDPIVCFKALADNSMTTEHADALKNCWPQIYKKAQDRIVQELADAEAENREIPFDARINVGTWLTVVTDISLTPLVYEAIQAVHAIQASPNPTQSPEQMAMNGAGPGSTKITGRGSTKASTKEMNFEPARSVSEKMQNGVGNIGA